jgi:hypothetical protein
LLIYGQALQELVIENSGYVLSGDFSAFDYFLSHYPDDQNDNLLLDSLHPNGFGAKILGEFRAGAIKSALEYQINPNNTFTGGNSHTS